ncbi:hypothetical protein Taro_054951 [Colocasia esculenta]|uniref:Uncharacterized protein n=1 Tax=Colocasia esculenta TaxID=4460 RepID=A0A843XQ22_COLES|nr:hypothetical protein [Colocasia esculenta]
MAATLSSLVTAFLDNLRSVINGEVITFPGVRSELEELEGRIKEIRCLLADAEGRAFYSAAIRVWLKELKEVMYDADDIVDDCKIAASGQLPEPFSSVQVVPPHLSSSLSLFNSVMFKHKIGKRLKGINCRLDEISRERSQFHLTSNVEETKKTSRLIGHQTSSLIHTDLIIGHTIQMDSKKLTNTLVGDEHDRMRLTVVAITGMGGIGKTTLAQVVYNDHVITAGFQLTAWVCVSKDFVGIKLLREIIACTGRDPGDAHTKEQLEQMLGSCISRKKIFLVLDDIWSANVWENILRNPLLCAAAGSKVLITTRFEAVARQMGAVHLHRVGQMSTADGWSLLRRKVCTHGEEEGDMVLSLRDVGVKIVERCGGLPLAIKVVGGVLRGRGKNREEWEEVLLSPTWSSSIFREDMNDMVMGALHLSYEDLPSHLKQCFLYLSLFPEDHVYRRPAVVRHWIAEGFVKVEGDTDHLHAPMLEEIGNEYFTQLVDRSLLQPQPAMIVDAECKMHDMLHSLAQLLAEDENLFGGTSDQLKDASPKLRRLSVAGGGGGGDDDMIDLDVLKTKGRLRTLILLKNPHGGQVLTAAIESLRHLRVLDLKGSPIEELPESVTSLRHLRYLDVSETAIRELPQSIAGLRSLQFLLLNKCRNIRALPDGITELRSLRSLELYRGTDVDQMPRGICGLTELRNLKDFVVHGDQGALEELAPLVNLYVLAVRKLERVRDKVRARSAALEKKASLFLLSLACTLPTAASSDEDVRRMADIYDELRPPPYLQHLHIVGYVGHTLPHWMWPPTPSSVSLIHHLSVLMLDCCINLCHLPPLWLLPHLNRLWIKSAHALKDIIPDRPNPILLTHASPSSCSSYCVSASNSTAAIAATTGNDTIVLFPKLEMLSLFVMPNLEKLWDCKGDGNGEHSIRAFPCLQEVCIYDCPKLTCLPGGLPTMKYLNVTDCPALMEVGNLSLPQLFSVHDSRSDVLPPWLAQVLVDPRDDLSFLILKVRSDLLRRILIQKEEDPSSPDWNVVKGFPGVHVKATDQEFEFLTYKKNPPSFQTNVQVTSSSNCEEREGQRCRLE